MLSPINVLMKTNVRRFSKHARAYLLTYLALDNDQKTKTQSGMEHTPITMKKIEQMTKSFRTHRSVLDCDTGFITDFTNE